MRDNLKSEIATKHLQSYSELTLQAPIKRGFVESLDSRTYATRLKMVMDTLHTLRTTSREYSLIRPFSDSTDRIRTINSLRMWIQPPEQKLVLSVGFDRPWETYLRIIWRDVGTLLDVIFCNCDGYPISSQCSFETYGRWITDARTDTRFFYNNSNLTVDDLQYLKQVERLHRDSPPALPVGAMADGLVANDLAAARLVAEDPEKTAIEAALKNRGESVTQGLQALSIIYRLADVYPPDTADGDILLRAAHQLLRELKLSKIQELCQKKAKPEHPDGPRERFPSQLEWFEKTPKPGFRAPADRAYDKAEHVQGGIVNGYPDTTHGCLLLIGIRDAVGAAAFIAGLQPTTETSGAPADGIYVNVAFSHDGLKKLGLTEAQLEAFPLEFREGMETRAGLLGDVRTNHPGNWLLPERNWPLSIKVGSLPARLPMSAAHIVVQLFVRADPAKGDHKLVGNPAHPLHRKVATLVDGFSGIELLSVQALRRNLDASFDPPLPRDHFGFLDGLSQPQIEPVPRGNAWHNMIARGDLLLGYENGSGDLPAHNELLHNGTFLVVRKLRQDVVTFEARIKKGSDDTGLTPEQLKSRMMGRDIATAAPLANPAVERGNGFDYTADPDARLCPFQSHIRRVNPRTPPVPANPPDPLWPDGRLLVPRLMRRGMSYGPRFEDEPEATDRGLMFMAYNASIGEQFEVIQRWLSGGNSTGVFSAEADPFLGVPLLGDARTFRFHDGTSVMRVQLDDPAAAEARPFVRLEWGAYLFVPSIPALAELCRIAASPQVAPSLVVEGERIIDALSGLSQQAAEESWKDVLEDSSARKTRRAQAVWAAIRARHAGVLRTPYGILVADRKLVMQVFQNASGRYSVCGYRERMLESFGEIYLGLDAGAAYTAQSDLANAEILKITEADAFGLARDLACKKLRDMIRNAKELAVATGHTAWELTFDIKELSDPVLAQVNHAWFDLPDEKHVFTGGWNWNVERPSCPGHFTAPSRYIFQPNPGATATRFGRDHGIAAKRGMDAFVKDRRAGILPALAGCISKPLFASLPDTPESNDLLARTLIGIMMGYLPTVEANLRATLNEWLEEKTFWDLQAALMSNPIADPYLQAKAVLKDTLMRTMQLRPLPELTWRRVAVPHELGGVAVALGETIVIGMVSATQQDLGVPTPPDIYPVFGGDRDTAGHPQHACPGYKAGMGVLLGIITALLEAGPWRPTPAPLTLRLRGTLP